MKRLLLGAVVVLSGSVLLRADTFKDVKYFYKAVGNEKAEQIDGALKIDSDAQMIQFRCKKTVLEVPSSAVTNLIYERAAKPRYAVGVLVAWPFLFTKSKQHYLTIQYTDQEAAKYALFKLDKGNYREILAAVEAATGKQVQRSEER